MRRDVHAPIPGLPRRRAALLCPHSLSTLFSVPLSPYPLYRESIFSIYISLIERSHLGLGDYKGFALWIKRGDIHEGPLRIHGAGFFSASWEQVVVHQEVTDGGPPELGTCSSWKRPSPPTAWDIASISSNVELSSCGGTNDDTGRQRVNELISVPA